MTNTVPIGDNKSMENKKTFEIVVAYEGFNTYTVEASSEEEAQDLVLSGEADVDEQEQRHFEVIESKEV